MSIMHVRSLKAIDLVNEIPAVRLIILPAITLLYLSIYIPINPRICSKYIPRTLDKFIDAAIPNFAFTRNQDFQIYNI